VKKYLTLIAILLLASGAATAREAKDKGAYVGGAFGVTSFEDDNALQGVPFDDSDTSAQIYGGYKFLRYFALEGRLLNLGTYGDAFGDFEATAVTVNAVGIVPFGQTDWEFFGQLGLGRINLDPSVGEDEDETVGSAGIGFRVTPIEHLSISIQFDAYAWEQDIGTQTFDWAIGTTQVAFHYNF
jgi:hypothetical protein